MTNQPTLRARYRSLRQRLDAPSRNRKTQRINQRLEGLAVLKTGQRIAAYLASPEEATIDAFIELAWQRQQSIFLPCIDDERGQMTFAQYHPDAPLKKNRFGLLEPAEQTDIAKASDLNYALVPLVAFDGHGNRLGMGGGYYDRFFAEPIGRPTVIGIAFSEQQTTVPLPCEQWDVPLNMVVTDMTIEQFTR